MDIVSTVGAWRELAQIPNEADRVTAWNCSYEAQFPSVFDVYYSAWGDRDRRPEAAVRAPALVSQVLGAEERARHLLSQAEGDFRALGLLGDDELHVVLMVGGHSSNGWVAEHAGRSSLFLALEFLGEPPHDDLLVVHELAHVVQAQRSAATRTRSYPAALGALVEGAAVATSRALRPGHTDTAYLWMDDDHEEWLDSCAASAGAIAALLLQHADTPDDAAEVAPLFRNRPGFSVPARSGYWAGDLIARAILEEGYRLRDLLSLDQHEARERVVRWAKANATNRRHD